MLDVERDIDAQHETAQNMHSCDTQRANEGFTVTCSPMQQLGSVLLKAAVWLY